MIQGKTVLGIVPARGGSKRIPRKNLVELAGKPLIAYTIEAGLRSRFIDTVVVSTDDREIADVSRSLGAQVPFLRPAELALDESSTFDAVQHAVDYYKQIGKEFGYIVLLQATSPLRDSGDIDNAVELLLHKQADAVISVCEVEHNPLWANKLPEDLSMNGFLTEAVKNKRSQDLAKYYRLNGAIYICAIERLLQEKSFSIKENIFAYIMPLEKSVDIDTMLDLKLCEILLKEDSKALHAQD